jgi:ribosomal protein S18 acetylase RimI-like enzyme
MSAQVLVRPRTDDDLDASERLAFAVHEVDGYPVHVPADMRKFLVAPDELTAWVAELDGEVVGHVALHPRCSQPSTDVVRGELGLGPGDYGVVARLLVSPAARRQGIGRRLLDAARSEAASRQLVPVLEVVTHHEPAINLYEAFGWRRIGQAAIQIPDRSPIDVFVYVYDGSVAGPAPVTPPAP